MLDRDLEPDLPTAKEAWVDERVEELLDEAAVMAATSQVQGKPLHDYIDWDAMRSDLIPVAEAEWQEQADERQIERWEAQQEALADAEQY